MEAVQESEIIFEVDTNALGRYLRLTNTEEELQRLGVDSMCPKRKIRRGRRPGVASRFYTQTRGEGPKQDELDLWEPPTNPPNTQEQIRRLMAVALKTAIEVFMKHHVYQFGGSLKVQEEGGSIGASITVQLSRVVMRWWDIKFSLEAERSLTQLGLNTRYVDDILVALVWDKAGTGKSQEQASKKELEKHIMAQLKQVADNILEMLEFTFDYPTNNKSGWMPCLDIQLRSEECQLEFKYYEKPCSNSTVIQARSAMGQKPKRTSLIQEGLRRLLNTSTTLPEQVMTGIMEDYACKLMRSGYFPKMRSDIIHGALSAYQCRLRQDREGTRPLYRSREYKRNEREQQKILKRETWYQKGRQGLKPETVIFITATPESELANNINKKLKERDIPVKVAEKSGQKLCRLLMKTNPHQSDVCGREGCFVCESREEDDKGKSRCWQEGVTYSIECKQCQGEEKPVYIGETASTAFVRGSEHQSQLVYHNRETKSGLSSVLGRHNKECHNGAKNTEFQMKVLTHHLAQCHMRQVTEAVMIENSKSSNLMNNRNERGADRTTDTSIRRYKRNNE